MMLSFWAIYLTNISLKRVCINEWNKKGKTDTRGQNIVGSIYINVVINGRDKAKEG